MKNKWYLLIMILVLISCNNSKKENTVNKTENKLEYTALQKRAQSLFGELPKVAKNDANPVTAEKVALGKKLYFETKLSKNGNQSCNTCHNLNTYGVDNLPTSPGDGKGTLGTRNSPTTLNAALHIAQFWDGREPDVEAQAGGPILNPVEMGMPDEKTVIRRLSKEKEYREMFAKAFPDEKNPINYKNLKKAIGAFERKLITPSKFDKFLAGDAKALNEKELKGLQLFIDKGCITCHNGNALGGKMFQKFGLYGNYWEYTKSKSIDKGKAEVSKKEADNYIFKTPSLRNITKTYPYFHDGSVKDLKEAIKIMGKLQVNKDLTDDEVQSIYDFLETLTGEVPAEYKM
ncbi:MAG: cytochrome-c peroxidase [Flavobacteriia bacterium]|nr:MAG: cytochrome-c peroxidase [Flavobacteriia bacterium]